MLDLRISYNTAYPQVGPLAMLLAREGVPPDAKLIYSGRNRVYRLVYHGLDVCIKEFKVPSWINRFAYSFVRKSKAMRSYEYATKLRDMGIDTPEPLACVEMCRKAMFDRSYYVCRYVEGDEIRHWEQRADCDAMLAALGREMAKIHSLGVFHKDFSPGNVLVTGNEKDGYAFCLVDINRMKFDVKSRKKQMRNFKSIHSDEGEVARLAGHYARAIGADERKTQKQAVAQLRRYKRKKRILHAFKPKKR